MKQPRTRVSNHQMVADEIELVAVEAGSGGNVQAFTQFTIEDQIAEALAGDEIVEAFRHSDAKERSGGEGIFAAVLQDCVCCHVRSFGTASYESISEMEWKVWVSILATKPGNGMDGPPAEWSIQGKYLTESSLQEQDACQFSGRIRVTSQRSCQGF